MNEIPYGLGSGSEVYIQPSPVSGAKWQVSVDGGSEPLWRGDGRELFYLTEDGQIMSVAISGGPSPDLGKPQRLCQTSIGGLPLDRHYTVMPDGQRFLINSGG